MRYLKSIGNNGLNKDIEVEELTLMMPNLLRVDVKKSSLRVLKVAVREKGFVKYVTAKNGCKVVEMGL